MHEAVFLHSASDRTALPPEQRFLKFLTVLPPYPPVHPPCSPVRGAKVRYDNLVAEATK